MLPGVTVTVTNSETKVGQMVVTDDNGLYQVVPGTYSVTAELSGFKAATRARHEVRVGDVLRINLDGPQGVSKSRAPHRYNWCDQSWG